MEKREKKSMGKKESFFLDKSNVAAYMLAGLIVENKKECLINPAIIYAESGNGKSHIVGIIKENQICSWLKSGYSSRIYAVPYGS